MLPRPAAMFDILLSIGCLLMPAAVHAQTADEGDMESLNSSEAARADEKRPDLERAARLVIKQTNAFREEHGREPVEVNRRLAEAAQYFADFMARTNQYGHTADGNRPAGRATEHGYDYCIVSENIAYQYSSAGFATEELATKFVEGWEESPGHRKNMLDPAVTETGVAVARSEDTGYYYAVQMFGRPKSKQFEFTVANESGETVEYRLGKRTFSVPPRYTRTHKRCRPSELTFLLKEQEKKTVEPQDGDQFTVTQDQGALRVRQQ